uniref:Uncharacterized protein n=1 Tax=Lepeophtheirus salmonis TaxID=72036 RepID=A0A0K2UXF3_LEPSM
MRRILAPGQETGLRCLLLPLGSCRHGEVKGSLVNSIIEKSFLKYRKQCYNSSGRLLKLMMISLKNQSSLLCVQIYCFVNH